MSTKIQEEYEQSRKYELSEINGEKLAELTLENVAKVEAMIRTDSNYRIALDDSEKSPYWILEMKKLLNGERGDYDKDYVVKRIVTLLNKENSTHLNTDGVGLDEMPKRILEKWDNILDSLRKRERGMDLIKFLSEKTPAAPGKKGRQNVSFASKFCHFSCFYIFKGEEAQDNFSIYDGVVANALPAYLDYYEQKLLDQKIDLKKIKKEIKNKNYEEYSRAIDAIIEASGSQISRNGFDHLVWYYFKGEPKKTRRKNKQKSPPDVSALK